MKAVDQADLLAAIDDALIRIWSAKQEDPVMITISHWGMFELNQGVAP